MRPWNYLTNNNNNEDDNNNNNNNNNYNDNNNCIHFYLFIINVNIIKAPLSRHCMYIHAQTNEES